ncbi:TSUP family transporter [Alphaproteobacteria bacterium HT1-32]|nr:TSUP family transporter [Alphaproteobacteria bacterium HT1-32]|tara:strand:- start:7024 stop:7791 length:768 start_codon:yes stop_codon:yes gene_type:complete
MSLTDGALLALAGFVAGSINSIAGGGTFFTFSALLAVGVSPVAANATSAIAVVPGSVASVLTDRRLIQSTDVPLRNLMLISLIGGGLGAWLVLRAGDVRFAAMVPWLLFMATALFALGPRLAKISIRFRARYSVATATLMVLAIQFVTSTYGGFFGAGMGIIMLAALVFVFGDDYRTANACKNLFSIFIQFGAIVLFLLEDVIAWHEAGVITVASILGGWIGVLGARKVPVRLLRAVVITCGALLGCYYLYGQIV